MKPPVPAGTSWQPCPAAGPSPPGAAEPPRESRSALRKRGYATCKLLVEFRLFFFKFSGKSRNCSRFFWGGGTLPLTVFCRQLPPVVAMVVVVVVTVMVVVCVVVVPAAADWRLPG